MSSVVVQRAAERAHLNYGWLTARHSFPFAGNFDHAAYAHGLLLVNNDDIIEAGSGFDTHQHRDTEIVTWVLSGSLVHQDSAGHSGVIHRGLAQRMSAGTGILHSERNDRFRADGSRVTEPVHLVQMWIPPDESGVTPSYQELDINSELRRRWPDHPGVGDARASRPQRDQLAQQTCGTACCSASRPVGRYLSRMRRTCTASIAGGTVDVEGVGLLGPGDSLRLKDTGGQRVEGIGDAEILVWEMHASTN